MWKAAGVSVGIVSAVGSSRLAIVTPRPSTKHHHEYIQCGYYAISRDDCQGDACAGCSAASRTGAVLARRRGTDKPCRSRICGLAHWRLLGHTRKSTVASDEEGRRQFPRVDWRKGGDSNPRGVLPPTRFPVARTRPDYATLP